jgi:dienelactone hydrolase
MEKPRQQDQDRFLKIAADSVTLDGILNLPADANGVVMFLHGSGVGRHGPAHQYIAEKLQEGGLATMLFDLLTPEEAEIDERTEQLRSDFDLLAERTVEATDWLTQQPYAKDLGIGYLAFSAGVVAALTAAAHRPDTVQAVMTQGGRPDMAASSLSEITVPVLLVAGGLDTAAIDLNERVLDRLNPEGEKKVKIVPGARQRFEEPGELEHLARLAQEWFQRHLIE